MSYMTVDLANGKYSSTKCHKQLRGEVLNSPFLSGHQGWKTQRNQLMNSCVIPKEF